MVKKLLNPDATVTNTLELTTEGSGCCLPGLTDCQYSATVVVANVNLVTGLKLDIGGTDTAFPFASVPTSRKDFRQKIVLALRDAGYILVDGGVTVEQVSTNYEVKITGVADITSFTTTTSDIAFTQACTQTVVCKYVAYYAGSVADPVVVIGEDEYTVANETVDEDGFVYPTDEAKLETALATFNTAAAAVTAVELTNLIDQDTWEIRFTAAKGLTMTFNGNPMTECCCQIVFA